MFFFMNSIGVFAYESGVPDFKNEESEIIEFEMYPLICVLTAEQDTCKRSITITFEEIPTEKICIFVKGQQQTKQCFSDLKVKSFKYKVHADTNILLVMRGDVSRQVYGAKEFKVTQYKPKRLRRRFGWGLL